MAKYVTREIDGVEHRGIEVAGHFVTKMKEGGYCAIDSDGKLAINENTQKEVIARLNKNEISSSLAASIEETQSEEAPKMLQIVMLPPRPGMPNGHLLRVATQGDKLLWSKITSSNDTYEINKERNEVIRKAAEHGYRFDLYETCYPSYRNAQRDFSRDPIGVIKRLKSPRHTNGAEQHESF